MLSQRKPCRQEAYGGGSFVPVFRFHFACFSSSVWILRQALGLRVGQVQAGVSVAAERPTRHNKRAAGRGRNRLPGFSRGGPYAWHRQRITG